MVQERLAWLDALRLIAGVSMVGLHATADPHGQPFPDWPIEDRIIPLVIRAVIYTARTELFLIISIFLLLMALDRRPRSYRATIMEQTQRLLIPFAFWTVFYAFFSLIKAHQFGYATVLWAQLNSPMTWVEYFVLGSSKYHMHFLPTLFGLVLLYPVFRLAKEFPVLGLAIIACLVLKREIDVFLWGNLTEMPGFDFVLRLAKILTYAGYGLAAAALLGIWQKFGPSRDLGRWFPLVLLFGFLLFSIKLVATYKTAVFGAWPHNYTAGYWADFLMPCLLFSGCMVMAFRQWPPVISRIAKYSFGIYLCHPIILDGIEIVLRDLALLPWQQVVLKMTVAIGLTTLLVLALERTRLLAWTVGLGPLPFQRPKHPISA